MRRSSTSPGLVAALVVCILLAGGCSDSPSDVDSEASGSVDVVRVSPGQAVQIRSISTLSDRNGEPTQMTIMHAVAIAIEDYGLIHGRFAVGLGEPLDDLCSAEGGEAAAMEVVADSSVVGVIGPSCSVASTEAAPLISRAGMVLISSSNTSPALTSNLAGVPGDHYYPGYYRTAHNDLYQGRAVADFIHEDLGHGRVAAVHIGEAYTEGLAQAFLDAFEQHGGIVTSFIEIDPEATDLMPVLAEIASGSPDALFMPLFSSEGRSLAEQARAFDGLEDLTLIGADSLLTSQFLELDFTRGMYLAGPDLRFGENANWATGANAEQISQRFLARIGESPDGAFWAHAYDATTLLLDAITASSHLEGQVLAIDRAAVRQYLNQVEDLEGVIGTIDCDEFGDCSPAKISIIKHLDPGNPEASLGNVVYEFSP
ncbi:branched-chain amino acid ABC transporter substrate-binding protein [Candidatus Poriferisocius sp.]|uniref:branched-chain amino acid ABC transporter substrate-binding protein n=1 Tax=Candidatus Poriferisocius sp. TaxID=3101276 RepID=UPI003B01D34C